jgi:outer membrane protein assembly factor BamD
MKTRLSIACLTTMFLVGCSSEVDLTKFEHNSPEAIYKEANAYVDKGAYSDAIKIYEEMERLHPYSKLAASAKVKRGDCYYKMHKFEDAAGEYEVFLKTHTAHELVPYALYMIGVVHYEQMPIVERDQTVTVKGLEYLYTLNREFPNSQYKKDADRMIKEMRQQLAAGEVYVAKYYQRHGNYAAAVSRLNLVIEAYRETEHVSEAMHRLVECYVAMGFFDEARRVYDVLRKKSPTDKWTAYSAALLAKNTVAQK